MNTRVNASHVSPWFYNLKYNKKIAGRRSFEGSNCQCRECCVGMQRLCFARSQQPMKVDMTGNAKPICRERK